MTASRGIIPLNADPYTLVTIYLADVSHSAGRMDPSLCFLESHSLTNDNGIHIWSRSHALDITIICVIQDDYCYFDCTESTVAGGDSESLGCIGTSTDLWGIEGERYRETQSRLDTLE